MLLLNMCKILKLSQGHPTLRESAIVGFKNLTERNSGIFTKGVPRWWDKIY